MTNHWIDLARPESWPVRMIREEVATAVRISQRELRRRIAQGRFPHPDDGRSWHRDVVKRYADGQIRTFERQAEKQQRREQLHVVGGSR